LTQSEFKKIFNNHFDEVRNYIYYRSGDVDLATDVAQETFIKLWEKQFDVQSKKIKGLLFKIAGDLFVSIYRKQKTVMNFKLNTKPDQEEITPEDKIQFDQLQENYSTALSRLPEKQRIVFMMSRIEELKYHEIAERLEISTKAVEKRMKNALEFLRQALNYQ
jgi:RNA polymerase sigma-70 factor (ECF subfamily)